MKKILISVFVIFALPSQLLPQTGAELMRFVKQIEGKPPEGRRQFIKDQLRRWKVRYHTMAFQANLPFRDSLVRGENIIVPMGKGKKKIIVGAHSDAVPKSPGANDNGGGVAVVLGLIKGLMDYQWNHKVDFCFFDQEEGGLLGSKEFVKKYKDKENHLAMINLDVEGTGDEVFVGPVGGGDDNVIMPIARKAAKRTGYTFIEATVYPPSDYMSFANAKLENISVSVLPKGDADKLVSFLSNHKVNTDTYPQVMKVMHTPHDSSAYMSPKALGISFEFTRTLLMLLNETK
ncbi:MAG: M20/M25/M40 family metallo-hydrolase [Ignavibacteriales bacterium]|nr:M20/M25/M40 family metallo-hydrolase [Ignavibacteriales bacterium]